MTPKLAPCFFSQSVNVVPHDATAAINPIGVGAMNKDATVAPQVSADQNVPPKTRSISIADIVFIVVIFIFL
jgi:hypothetical protein